MDPAELALLIITLTLLLAVLILLVVLLIKSSKNKVTTTPYDDSRLIGQLGELKANVGLLKEANANAIKLAIGEEMIKVSSQNEKTSDIANQRLAHFQAEISDSLQKRMDALTKSVGDSLQAINKRVDERLDAGFKTTGDNVSKMIESLSKIEEARKKVEELSGEVVTLSSILSNNQKRGQFGEFTLQRILENVFGATKGLYAMQYELKVPDRELVRPDAVVFLPEPNKLVCIDSKFPFSEYSAIYDGGGTKEQISAFKRDVQNRIKEVASKYIVPGYTSKEALLFIPSDGIYAYINVNFSDLVETARQANVIITSPATLQPMLNSIHGLIIEYERAQKLEEINEALAALDLEFKRFAKRWQSLSSSITTMDNTRKQMDTTVHKINQKFSRISKNRLSESTPEEIEENDDEE